MLIAWAITYAAIAGGVKSGIERAAKIMMPILFYHGITADRSY